MATERDALSAVEMESKWQEAESSGQETVGSEQQAIRPLRHLEHKEALRAVKNAERDTLSCPLSGAEGQSKWSQIGSWQCCKLKLSFLINKPERNVDST